MPWNWGSPQLLTVLVWTVWQAPLGGALPWARSKCKSAVGLFSPQSCGCARVRTRVRLRERDRVTCPPSAGGGFALRSAAPLGRQRCCAWNGRCSPESLAFKGEMMARLSPEIKVPQQTLSAIQPRKGGAHASPERENSNFTRQIKLKTGAKESSGAFSFYLLSTDTLCLN